MIFHMTKNLVAGQARAAAAVRFLRFRLRGLCRQPILCLSAALSLSAASQNPRYPEERLGILAQALKAGNPKRIVALNPGVQDRVRAYSRHEDYTCGEQNRFLDQPSSRWVGGEQWHILSFLGHDRSGNYLGAGWGQPGVRFSKADLIEYVADVNRAGGVVSVDVLLFRDGGLDRSQLEVLRPLRPGLAAALAQPPIPPGNLAFHKPAHLLSLKTHGP